MRDITLGETLYHFFSTRAFATGVPTQLAGTPALSVLEENNATPITSGVSVAVDRASVTGLNQATIVATSGNGYEAGKSYAIYISTGTVGGVSVVGEVVGEFTIQQSAAFTRLGSPAGASVSADILAIDNLVDDLESRVGIPNGGSVAADLFGITLAIGTPSNLGSGTALSANLADIEGQTDDIGAAGAGLTALGDTRIANLDATVSSRATPAQVNAEVVDTLNVDTYAEPGQGAPAATASLAAKINYLFKAWRNKKTQTATQLSLLADDAVTVDQKATVSDDGTTTTVGEIAGGP